MIDFIAHLYRQKEWSEKTFGPGERTEGIIDHITEELEEVKANPTDLSEWIDIVILALDGAWRVGGTPKQIVETLIFKQAKNEARVWPDWRTAPKGKIKHIPSPKPFDHMGSSQTTEEEAEKNKAEYEGMTKGIRGYFPPEYK